MAFAAVVLKSVDKTNCFPGVSMRALDVLVPR